PRQAGGIDAVIPPDILSKAKGFAILTVIKAGFVWSGRAGSGLVVARLPDGTWSAPSGIGSAGVGFGGQIGAQITDFLIILNTADAVKAFSEGGNVTLGEIFQSLQGHLGDLLRLVAHKSKGLFAGVSIEGSVILERKDANAKFYGRQVRAKELLSGAVPPPGQASILYQALNSKAAGIPSPTKSAAPSRLGSYKSPGSSTGPDSQGLASSHNRIPSFSNVESPPGYSPGGFKPTGDSKRRKETAVALYDYEASQSSDLSFKRGDIITIEKKTVSQNDWWKGSLDGKTGDFPANYVEL
ncbi:hypothetical protein L0F63_005456, partial [Massospora cicadina]